jgi:kumamolisin
MRKTVPLSGSELRLLPGARVKGPVSGDEPIEVRITLKAPSSLQKKADELSNQPVEQRKYLTRDELEKTYATDQATIEKLEDFAREFNLAVSRIDPAQHAVYLTGNARDISLAFQTHLETYEHPDGRTYRAAGDLFMFPQTWLMPSLA